MNTSTRNFMTTTNDFNVNSFPNWTNNASDSFVSRYTEYDPTLSSEIIQPSIHTSWNSSSASSLDTISSNEPDPIASEELPAPISEVSEAASSASKITEDVGEASEALEIGEDVASGGILLPATIAAQMLDSGFNAINEGKATSMNTDAQQNYTNTIGTGHGIGYQTVAADNLSMANQNASNFQTYSKAMTSIMGPLGGFIASLTPTSAFATTPSDTYTANTVSGEQVNAQAPDIVQSDSS